MKEGMGTQLALLVEQATLDLGAVSSHVGYRDDFKKSFLKMKEEQQKW